MPGVNPNTVLQLSAGAGRGQPQLAPQSAVDNTVLVAQAAIAAHTAEAHTRATEAAAAGEIRALYAEGNAAIAATNSAASQAVTYAQAGREIETVRAQAGVAVTQAMAGREVDHARAQAGVAVTEAQAGRQVDAARAQCGLMVNEAEAAVRTAQLEAKHEKELAGLRAQLELERRTAKLTAPAPAPAPSPLPAPTQAQAPGIEEEDLASLRRQIRHEEEKRVLQDQLLNLRTGNDGAHLTGGVGSDHQLEEITRGPLMGGLASIDVDAWWEGSAEHLSLVHVHQREHYRELVEAKAGAHARPQAHEAHARLRELGTVMARLPSIDNLEEAERLIRDMVKENIARLEILREGVTGGGWTAAQEMEDAHFVAPSVPPFLRKMWVKKGKTEKPSQRPVQRPPATKSRH